MMRRSDAVCVWQAGAILGEGPIWSVREQAVYWVDIHGPRVHRYSLTGGPSQSWEMPDWIGWIVERTDHPGFVAGFRQGFATLSLDPLVVRFFGYPEAGLPENRLNDATVDAAGRIWAGSMDNSQERDTGCLYRIDPNWEWAKVDSGYKVANGPTLSPDGRLLYHTESLSRVIYRFDMNEEGELANKRPWVQLAETDGFPDGMTTDAEGFVWVAIWGKGCVRRFDPQGKMEREVFLPVSRVTSCVFAGDNLDRLFVTSASIGAEKEPMAGALFEVDPGVRGLPSFTFAG